MSRFQHASTLNRVRRAWESCCLGPIPCVQTNSFALYACFPARSRLWENAPSSPPAFAILIQEAASRGENTVSGGRDSAQPYERGAASSCPSKPTPWGYKWGADALLPNQPTPLTDLELCSGALTHDRQLLQAVKGPAVPTAEPEKARQAPAVSKDTGLAVVSCDQGWHPRSWEHLLTCSLPSVLGTVNVSFQGLSLTLSSSTRSCASLILGAAWFWYRWLCLCFWEVLCHLSV